jgi:PPOX class probable FMN-dependent enzyme
MSRKAELPGFSTHAEMQQQYGEPLEYGLRMHIDYIHHHHRTFIAHSPFLVLTSCDRNGYPTASPKGDCKGFVQVIDEKTLLIPDRPGNNQLQTLHNVLDNAKVGAIFFVPGIEETLRVRGIASLSTNPELLASFIVNGKTPKSAIRIHVEEAYMHCGKALRRSQLWQPDQRVERSAIPTIAKMMVDQTGPVDKSIEELDALQEQIYRTTLY